MTREEAFKEFKKVLWPYTANKDKLDSITEETDLIKDLQINSANLVDIIIDAENYYHVEIDNDSVEKMVNVGSCIDVILKKMNEENG
ncbi:MAG TPA: acyl carrier protein [Chitinophagaceae bacterium]|jgi:acyl carrier protein